VFPALLEQLKVHFLEMKRAGNNRAIMKNPADISTSQLFFGTYNAYRDSEEPIDMGTLMLIVEVQSQLQTLRLERLKFVCNGITYDNQAFDSLSFNGVNSLHIHSILLVYYQLDCTCEHLKLNLHKEVSLAITRTT
jgi:hypothetical protein